MKKIIFATGMIALLLSFTGCGSTEKTVNKSEVQDSYENEAVYINDNIIQSSDDDDDVQIVDDVYDDGEVVAGTNKKSSNKLLDGLLSSSFKYYAYDTFSLYSPNVLNKMKQTAGTVIYVPKTETIGFGANCLAAYYYVHFDDVSRQLLINDYKQYLRDFENKKLNRKDKKSIKAYGSINVKLNWGTVKTSCPNNGETQCLVGYEFKDGSPYFKLTIYPTLNYKFIEDKDVTKESIFLNYYFTKAQGAALMEALSKESVEQAVREYNQIEYGGDIQVSDEY